jgi:HNH endonuclease
MSSVASKTTDEKKPKKKTVPKVVRDLSWNKWVGEDVAKTKCFCCGVNEIRMNSFHCGHVLAEANGGKTTVDNLRPICAACNLSMGTDDLEEFKKRCGFGSVTVAPAPVVSEPSIESQAVAWYPGLLLNSSPKYVKWQKGTNSLDMMRELESCRLRFLGRYTQVGDIYVRQ